MAPIKSTTSSPTPIPTATPAPAKPVAPAPKPAAPGEVHHWTKDGYIDFKAKDGMPSTIKLPDGDTVTVKRLSLPGGGHAYSIKGGKHDQLAVPTGGGTWAFFRPANGGTATLMGPRGEGYVPVSNQNTSIGRTMLERAFVDAVDIAKGRQDAMPTSLADKAAAQKKLDVARAPDAAKSVDDLMKSTSATRAKVESATQKVAKAVDRLPIALEKGVVVAQRNKAQNNEVTFELAPKPAGMSDKEYDKLKAEFGPKLADFTNTTRIAERELSGVQGVRRQNAAALFEQIHSGPFIAHLESLPPAQRMEKLNAVATSLAGTPEGRMLADDLLGRRHGQETKDLGRLTPESALGRAAFKDVMADPKARAQLTGLALNLSSQMTTRYGRGEALSRAAEVAAGRVLTEGERLAAYKAGDLTPEALAGPGAKPFDQYGDLSQLFAVFGESLEPAAITNGTTLNKSGLGHSATAAKVGAAAVATFQFMRGLNDIASNGLSYERARDTVEDMARQTGAWANVLAKDGSTFAKVGKIAGTASDAIGFIKDVGELLKASETARYDKFVNAYAGGLILVGGLVGGPFGLAAALVGTGVKLLAPKKSEEYVEARETLKEATKSTAEIEAEKRAEAAKQAAHNARVEKKVWRGTRF